MQSWGIQTFGWIVSTSLVKKSRIGIMENLWNTRHKMKNCFQWDSKIWVWTDIVEQVVYVFSRVQRFPISCTEVHQSPLFMEFTRQEHWSGLPFPPPRGLPDPGIEPASLAPAALAGGFFTTVPSGKPISGTKIQHHFWALRNKNKAISKALDETCLEGSGKCQFPLK